MYANLVQCSGEIMSYQREMQKSLSFLAIAAIMTFGAVTFNSLSSHNQVNNTAQNQATQRNFASNTVLPARQTQNLDSAKQYQSPQPMREQQVVSNQRRNSQSQSAADTRIENIILESKPRPSLSNNIVQHLQNELSIAGYYNGEIDGMMGPQTQSAMSSYMIVNNLTDDYNQPAQILNHIQTAQNQIASQNRQPVETYPNLATNDAVTDGIGDILSSNPISGSISSPQPAESFVLTPQIIQNVQSVLQDFGLDPGRVDGKIGYKTTAAIQEFQRLRNMPQTGEISINMIETLERISQRKIM